jgi:hypothetical protein
VQQHLRHPLRACLALLSQACLFAVAAGTRLFVVACRCSKNSQLGRQLTAVMCFGLPRTSPALKMWQGNRAHHAFLTCVPVLMRKRLSRSAHML